MYQTLLIVQYIGIAILASQLLFIASQRPSRLQKLIMILQFSLLIEMIAYTIEMKATNLPEAMIAVKFGWLGKPFIVLAIMLTVTEYCRIMLPKWLISLLVSIQAMIVVLVFTCESHTLFYTSLSFSWGGLFPHVVKSCGIAYYVYSVLIFLYVLATIWITVTQFRTASSKQEKMQLLTFAVMLAIAIGSFVVFLSGATGEYDCTIIGYLIGALMLSVSYHKLDLLDTVSLAREQMTDYLKNGLLVYDNHGNLVYENEAAKKISVEDFIASHAEYSEPYIFKGRVYSTEKQDIEKDSIYYGSLFVVNDITDRYYHTSRLQEEVEKKTEKISEIQRKVVLGMADIVESRDGNTGGHVKRTSEVVRIFIDKLKERGLYKDMPPAFWNDMINSAPMHDLGKIAIDDAVLRKQGKYEPSEYEEMKTHSAKGAKIVEQVLNGVEDEDFLNIATNVAHYHHEKWDGSGYPAGLKAEDIPLEARIMALADVFDALVSKRCYKDEIPYDKAFAIIEDSLGSHFDEKLGRYFLECREELMAYYDSEKAAATEEI